jgi:Cu(I)/Ag(I) efflux system membrane protein CusA/SilA
MRYFEVDANIVALSGIAIAIGTIVDVGIVLSESMLIHIQEAPKTQKISTSVYNATTEVASAIVTAVATTVVSFLPVFTMEAAEGKLFRPLAFTKTFVLLASIVVALTIIPPLATQLFSIQSKSKTRSYLYSSLLVITGIVLLITSYSFLGIFALLIGFTSIISEALKSLKKETWNRRFEIVKNILYAMLITCLLSEIWMPLGVTKSIFINFLFVGTIIGSLISIFYAVIHFYESILRFLLKVKFIFLSFICLIIVTGVMIARNTGKEFMPSLDEGSFLLMPTAMPHAGMQMNISNLRTLDMAVTAIPEVEMVVGKAGRTESSLDPAPMSMYENMILYKTEYATSKDGHRLRFKTDNSGNFILKDERSISNAEAIAKNLTINKLIQDEDGAYFRQWREHIHSADDIWNEIVAVTKLPGVTSAPKLQPIETRLIMLQTGMRAPKGIKVKGDNLESIEAFGIALETILTTVEGVKPSSVFADRIIGKPYLMIDIDRNAISRYGLSIVDVQNQIQVAIGGMKMTTTVEDRERYNIVLRYPRELRDNPEKIKDIFISTKDNGQIPLGDIVNIRYEQGPQAIKSEDGFLIAYVLFDKLDGFAEAEVVENAQSAINKAKNDGSLNNPASINYKFAGNYEQQIRANDRLAIVIPLALFLIFLILYFQFNSILTSLMVFTGVFVAFSGGFIMIWFYGQDWFMNFSLFEVNMRDLFQMKTLNLSVAVWVGFLALFGIATDDGVLIATFLKDSFKRNTPQSIEEIRDAVVEGGLRRVKPAMMTTATTILALLPILTSTGKGAGIMLPMAIPSFGGMTLQVITMFTVPILYALWKESDLKYKKWKS